MTKDEMKSKNENLFKCNTILLNENEKLQKQIVDLEKKLEQEKQLNAEIKARFVKCNTCTDEMKSKCPMFSENLCEGERCEELVDLMALVSKSDLQKENEQLKQQIEQMQDAKCISCTDLGGILLKITDLEKKNTELKQVLEGYKENATWCDKCKQITKAIGIIKRWYETNRSACIEPSQELIEVTEQFFKEIEK